MKDVEKTRLVKLVEGIEHQEIGGKVFQIEKEGTVTFMLDEPFNRMTRALYNFALRRTDLVDKDESTKIYYGHVLETNLGYFIAEDEIEMEIG